MVRYTWETLAFKHRGWRAPAVSVTVSEKPILNREWSLQSLECDLTTEIEASGCTITLGNVYDSVKSRFSCEDLMILGSPIQVGLGYVEPQPVFTGYLYEVEYELGDMSQVTLHCMDVKGAMMENSFITGEATYRQAIAAMFSPSSARGYRVLCGAPATDEIPELDRPISFDTSRLDDFGFLRRTAELWGLECFVQAGKLLLRKKPSPETALVEFSPGTFHTLSAAYSTVGYVHTVRVRGGTDDERDGEKKRACAEVQNGYNPAPAGSAAASLLKRVSEFYAPDARDDKTAKQRAEGELRRRQRKSGDVNVSLRGLPELMPGHYVDFSGVSPKLNGRYYLTAVKHQFNDRSFTTNAVCRRD